MPEQMANPREKKENALNPLLLNAEGLPLMPWDMETDDEWRHPIETTTFYHLLNRYVYKHLGRTMEEWEQGTSDLEKMNFMTFIRVDHAKEVYSNLPKEEKAKFLM